MKQREQRRDGGSHPNGPPHARAPLVIITEAFLSLPSSPHALSWKGQRKVVLIQFPNEIEEAAVTSCLNLWEESAFLKCFFKNSFQLTRRARAGPGPERAVSWCSLRPRCGRLLVPRGRRVPWSSNDVSRKLPAGGASIAVSQGSVASISVLMRWLRCTCGTQRCVSGPCPGTGAVRDVHARLHRSRESF